MDIEGIPEHKWHDVILGKSSYEFKFLAAKIMLARLQRHAQKDQTNLQEYVSEFKGLFKKNISLPSVQKDLALIIEGGE